MKIKPIHVVIGVGAVGAMYLVLRPRGATAAPKSAPAAAIENAVAAIADKATAWIPGSGSWWSRQDPANVAGLIVTGRFNGNEAVGAEVRRLYQSWGSRDRARYDAAIRNRHEVNPEYIARAMTHATAETL